MTFISPWHFKFCDVKCEVTEVEIVRVFGNSMPKLKSSSASQAKKRKQKQREDPEKRLREQELDTAARKQARLDPATRF